jgi:hypothetical protein
MSAYDNPTIIKDNSGLILAQGLTAFSENFAKAAAAREARILEQKKEIEKQQKAADELIINQQTLKMQQASVNNKKTSESMSTISKTDVDLQRQIQETLAEDYDTLGNYQVRAATTVVSPEEIKKMSQFNQNLEKGKDNALKMAGGLLSSINEYAAMGAKAVTDTVWNGDTPIDRWSNQVTCAALDPKNVNYDGKVLKKYERDKENPSKAVLRVETNMGSEVEAFRAFNKYFPNTTDPGDIAKAWEEAKSKNNITKNEKGEIIVNFQKPIGEGWDYSFYKTVPKLTEGTELDDDHAGIISKEAGGIKDKFLLNSGVPVFNDVSVSSGLNKNNKTAYTETLYADMPGIRKASEEYYNFNIQGLMQSSFKDVGVLQGFLQNRLKRPDLTIERFQELYKTEKAQIDFMAKAAMELDIEDRLTSTKAGSGRTWTKKTATKADVEAGRAEEIGEYFYYSTSNPIVYAKDTPADNKLTQGQKIQQENLAANLAVVTAWGEKGDKDKSSCISPDGDTSLAWDASKGLWMPYFKNPSNGAFQPQTGMTGYPTKAEAARNYFRK